MLGDLLAIASGDRTLEKAETYLGQHQLCTPIFRRSNYEGVNADAVRLIEIGGGTNIVSQLIAHANRLHHHVVEDGDTIVLAPGA